MKCFYSFKDKAKSRKQKSAPELKGELKSVTSGEEERGIKSSGSAAAAAQRTIPELYEEKAQNLRVFSFSELRKATNDFNRLLKIGEGGFGSVYKGSILPPDGRGDRVIVAVKKLKRDGLQGHKQWVAEVQFLGVVEHPNLVKLIGYCAVDGERGIQRLLVYEFMPNKSLEDHIFNKSPPALSWNRRLQIVLGVAEGLAYLHGGLEVEIIYRDFKSSNVLLDENFKPKLSDFGLAREGPTGENTHVSTAVVGTYGYAAPDYVETGHLTTKSDVWSFGVVLYEVLTGRQSLDRNRPRMEQKLLEWVRHFPAESSQFSMIMDPRLGGQYSIIAAKVIAKLADGCLSKNRNERPKMSEVVNILKQAIQISEARISTDKRVTNSSGPERVTSNAESHQMGAPESAKRRMAQLNKLRENANGV